MLLLHTSCYQEPCTTYQGSEEEEFGWSEKDGSPIGMEIEDCWSEGGRTVVVGHVSQEACWVPEEEIWDGSLKGKLDQNLCGVA